MRSGLGFGVAIVDLREVVDEYCRLVASKNNEEEEETALQKIMEEINTSKTAGTIEVEDTKGSTEHAITVEITDTKLKTASSMRKNPPKYLYGRRSKHAILKQTRQRL